MNNVVIVSGRQQRDSAIHIHVSILPQTPFPSRLPHSIEPEEGNLASGPELRLDNSELLGSRVLLQRKKETEKASDIDIRECPNC